MVHKNNKWEASTPKKNKTNQKSKIKIGQNKNKSTNGKSNLKWL